MSNDFSVSIIIPVYNEEENIHFLADKLKEVMSGLKWELVFIDDGSTDGTLDRIRELERAESVKYISLSRNFGQQSALKAGLDHAIGDCVIMMDGDNEHPPALIPEMIKMWRAGHDIVITRRRTDGEKNLFRRFSSIGFYKLLNFLSDTKVEKGSADFRLLDRQVVEVLRQFPEQPVFLRALVNWLGFKTASLDFDPDNRHSGRSKYSKFRLVNLSLEGITSFSIKPLRISSFIGLTLSVLAMLYGLYAIYVHFFTNQTVAGWTSLLVLIAFIGGMQMIMIGVLGEYLGKLFIAAKQRPAYIIKEKSE